MLNKFVIFKSDVPYCVCIFVLLTILFFYLGNNIALVFSDIGREIYLSTEVANGKVLYKDLFNIFYPMGYFVNAIIVKIFNDSINTFILISYILSLSILLSIYKILSVFVTKMIAFLSAITVLLTCTFAPTLFHWNLPYSYSFFYALASIMWALYFILRYINTEQDTDKYLFYALILYSFSISCKYDFSLFLIAILMALIYKKNSLKNYLKSFIIIVLFPILSLIILFIQGCTITDLQFAGNFILNLIKSPIMHFFYQYAGIRPGEMLIHKLINLRFESLYSLIGYVNIVIFLIYILKKYDFKYILLGITCILLSVKAILFIDIFDWYGPMFFHFLFMNFIVFISYNIKKKYIVNLLIIAIILLNCYFGFIVNSRADYMPVYTSKGVFKIVSADYEGVVKMLDYIDKETLENDKILVLPEGILINYLTGRPTNGYIFHLISPNYEIFGEEYIFNLFLKQKFKYVIFQNYHYPEYNNSIFTEDWGINFFNLVQDKYNLDREFINPDGTSFFMYKLKD